MSFSAYLVGTWEGRFGIGTTLQIINPTLDDIDVIVAFLDDNEEFIRCKRSRRPLTPNKMWEIIVTGLERQFGVVKIISHKNGEVKPGIVGFQRHVIPRPTTFSEAPLAAIPMTYAQPEYERILAHCP